MLGALPNLLHSEKALMALALLIAATVLTAMGLLPITEWKAFAQGVFLIYVGGKTIQGSTELIASAMKAQAQARTSTGADL